METGYQNDEMEIDLKELFYEWLSHWKLIIFSAILLGAAVIAYTKFMVTPMYQSTSKLYVLSKSTSLTSLADLQMGTNLTNDYKVVVKGRPILDQVIDNLKLEEDYKQLGAKVSVNNPSDSRILEISVIDADPKRAKAIADEMADVSAGFISEKMDQEPPNVIQYGYVPSTQVSPSVKKNGAIGILLGAFIAIAFVTISYLLNDTILTPEDVEKKLGLHVLASLPLDKEEDDGEKKKKSTKKKKAE